MVIINTTFLLETNMKTINDLYQQTTYHSIQYNKTNNEYKNNIHIFTRRTSLLNSGPLINHFNLD